ncbi:MAG TPA: carbamoyl phosphate synthase large subunit, partial [bacterium]|nr:carbamoyl phosphate synthase large subunit [bacterium]
IQFLARENNIKVIECNLRASRSFPFCSKIFKQNMIDIATRAILGEDVKPVEKSSLDLDYVGVKAAQFSFSRLKGADPILGVEMASTGEVACIGHEINEAFLKAFISVGFKMPKKGILLSTGPMESKVKLLPKVIKLKEMGYELYATPGSAEFLRNNGVDTTALHWPFDKKDPNVNDHILDKKIDLVINIPKDNSKQELENDYMVRRMAVDFEIPLITNLQIAMQMIDAMEYYKDEKLEISSWDEY